MQLGEGRAVSTSAEALLSLGPIISPQTSLLKCHLLIPFNSHFQPAVLQGLTRHLLGWGGEWAQS